MNPAAARTPATPAAGWAVDRQFHWIVSAAFCLGVTYSLMPAGFRFVDDPYAVGASGGGDASFKLMWLPLLGLSAFIILQRFRWVMILLSQANPWGIAVGLWCFITAVWAPDPFATFKQAVSINVPLLVAIAFTATAWSDDRYFRLLAITFAALLGLSLVMGVVRPDIAIHNSSQFELAGSWRGITYQKNGLGQLSSIAVILWVWAWAARKVGTPLAAANIALALFLVLASRSSTSLLMSLLGSGVVLSLLRSPVHLQRHRGAFWLGVALMVLVPLMSYLLVAGGVDFANLGQSFGELFGKDVTFSGRTYIWAELLREIPDHALLGIGFNSFWGGPGSPADEALRRLGWSVPNGHSGYLDLINEIGFIGFGLFLLFVFRHGADLRRLAKIYPDHAALHIGLFVFILMGNLTETGWFKPIQFTHVVAMYSSMAVSRHLMEARLQAAQRGRSLASGVST